LMRFMWIPIADRGNILGMGSIIARRPVPEPEPFPLSFNKTSSWSPPMRSTTSAHTLPPSGAQLPHQLGDCEPHLQGGKSAPDLLSVEITIAEPLPPGWQRSLCLLCFRQWQHPSGASPSVFPAVSPGSLSPTHIHQPLRLSVPSYPSARTHTHTWRLPMSPPQPRSRDNELTEAQIEYVACHPSPQWHIQLTRPAPSARLRG